MNKKTPINIENTYSPRKLEHKKKKNTKKWREEKKKIIKFSFSGYTLSKAAFLNRDYNRKHGVPRELI